jgi:hypothetical protein
LDGDVDASLVEALPAEHGRVPSAPNDGHIRPCRFGSARHSQRVGNRRPGQHRDAEAYRALELRQNGALGVGIEASVDDHDFVLLWIELGPNREQRERHRVEDGARVVQDYFYAAALHALAPPLRVARTIVTVSLMKRRRAKTSN